MRRARILVVDDEAIVAADLQMILQNMGYSVPAVAAAGEEAIKMAALHRPDLVLMDIVLQSQMNGIEAAEQIRARFDIPVVYVTAHADLKTLERAKMTEPYGYIVKPYDEKDLLAAIEIALYKTGMERKLKESEAWLATTLRSIGDAVIATNAGGQVVFMNPVAQSATGWRQEEAAGRPLKEIFVIINEFSRAQVKDPVARVMSEGLVVGLANHTLLIARDGREVPIDDSAAPIKDGQGNILGIVLIFRDITERKQAERELAAEKERLTVTLQSIGDAVISTDTEENIVLLNNAAEQLTGWSHAEAVGRPLAEVFRIINEKTRQPCGNPAAKVLRSGRIIGLANHTALIARDGTERLIADSGAPIKDMEGAVIGVVLVFRDITAQRRMEEHLANAEKIEALGILAGGIAHDFNNLLTSIIGNLSLAKMQSKLGDQVYQRLTEAEKASRRAKDLTQQLITFARGGAPIKRTVPLTELIKDTALFSLRGAKVRCDFSIPADLWWCEIDEGQISQVINNLVINADHAMPQGGTIKICAENVIPGPADNLPLANKSYVRISILDNGIGIADKHLHRIFDPYFTTKHAGSGLGLATVYSIIKKHDGLITVDSQVGKGTSFHVYLPAAPEQIRLKKDTRQPLFVAEGRILIMDDDEMVRGVLEAMLREIGYQVASAKNGAEAIELYKKAQESGAPFAAVILDITVPGGMGGKEAVKRLLEIDPGVKAFVSSGYSHDPIMSAYGKYGFSGVLVKPYDFIELAEALGAAAK